MIQNTRIALAPYQAEYQFPHIKRCFNRFWYDPSGSNPLSVFFIKNCLWAGMGSTRYLNLIPKIQNLFGGRLPVFCCGGKFFFESFTFDLRFFPIHRSKKYRINCSSDSFLNPAFQLGLWHSRNHLAVKKWFRRFSGRSHPAKTERVLQLPWWSCAPFLPRCGSSCYP